MKKKDFLNYRMPLAQTKDIVVQVLENELLIYDLKSNRAHNLNETMAFVWDCCDGKQGIKNVTQLLSKKLNTKIETDFVYLAIEELEKSGLLSNVYGDLDKQIITRRDVLFKYSLPVIALPVVLSLAAPKATQAQSCVGLQGTCTGAGTGNCCPGIDACSGSVCCNGVGSTCGSNADCCNPFSCLGGQCV